MSLINQMLQDLEKRRQQQQQPDGGKITVTASAAAPSRRMLPLMLVVIAVAVVAASLGWMWWQRKQPQPPVMAQRHAVAKMPVVGSAPASTQAAVAMAPHAVSNVTDDGASAAVAVNRPGTTATAGAPAAPAAKAPTRQERQKRQKRQEQTVAAVSALPVSAPAPAPVPVRVAAPAATRKKAPAAVVLSSKLAPQQRAQRLRTRAYMKLQEHNYRAAATLLEQVLRKQDNVDDWYQLVLTYLHLRQSGAALDCSRRALARHPHHVPLVTLRARLLLERGQPREALQLLDTLEPPSKTGAHDYYALLATLQQQNGDYRAAAATYADLTSADSGNGRWWVGRAICAEHLRRRADAADYYRRALACGLADQRLKQFATRQLLHLHKK